MADVKISELSEATSLSDSDVLAGVNAATTRKFTLARLKAFFKASLTKADVGLGNVANVLQYSVENKPTPAAIGAVPETRTVNSKALSENIALDAADVGAVPTTRKVNNKALSSDVTLDKTDIGLSNVANVLQFSASNKPTAADVTYSGTVGGITVSDVKSALDNVPSGSNSIPSEDYQGGLAGVSNSYSRSDHVHPSDSSRVPSTRKINNKPLTTDIELDFADVEAPSMDDLAPMEVTSTASTNYSVGDYLTRNGYLYIVTSAIASGETITPGTNVSFITVVDITGALDTRVDALEDALDGLVSRLGAM